jgi:two-component system chemotaxis response regulator CheY
MRVLVVDDSRAMRMIVQREMRAGGVEADEVLEADCPASALEVLEGSEIDLVLSDWNMPGSSGLDLLQALRDRGYEGAFGFITSEASEATRNLAMEAGAAFLVTKPFTGDDLARNITATLGVLPDKSEESFVDDRYERLPPTQGRTVVSVLEELLHSEVSVVQSDAPRDTLPRVVARYENAEGRDVLLVVAEMALAASAGSALSKLPAASAAQWARSGVMTEQVSQNFHEVANVLASLVNLGGEQSKLAEVIQLADREPLPKEGWRTAVRQQVNLQISIQGYEPGRLAFVTLQSEP